MLISLDKNKWLYDWMQDQWQDELFEIINAKGSPVPRPNLDLPPLADTTDRDGSSGGGSGGGLGTGGSGRTGKSTTTNNLSLS